MGEFAGFPVWGVDFYGRLEEQNTREFWSENRAEWERCVRDPMRALVAALEPEFGPATVFRPNRDIRFSRDKSPYKTHQGAFVGHDMGVGYYVQISADGLHVGGGFRTHSPAQTEAFRAGIADDVAGPELERIVERLLSGGFTLEGAALKTKPRGYDADHPRIGLLRRKELMVLKDLGTPAWLATPAVLDHVWDAWVEVRPLATWVRAHVSPA